MANFAIINKDNIVISVMTVNNNILLIDEKENEQVGIDFLINDFKIQSIFPECVLIKQVSYNSKFRNKYPGKGDEWNEELDAFITKKPYPSWTLNKELKCYEAPTEKPEGNYAWNEEKLQWEEFKTKQ